MALRKIELSELADILTAAIAKAGEYRPVTSAIFQLLYNTGLRINEVLEVERWQASGSGTYWVQLSKREEKREIDAALIPAEIASHYANQTPYYLETYSAVQNTFRQVAPNLVIETKKKGTLLHAFRYRYIKSLYASGLSVTDIAAHMGHKMQSSSSGYILGQVWAAS